jgi:broad specificity polyphosphatase/5'/3'-nucleotidase SurE
MGRPGLAVSQAAGEDYQWSTAARLAAALVADAGAHDPPAAFNLNVPNRPLDRLKGVWPATLDPGGRVQAAMIEHRPGVLELQIPEAQPAPEGTDTALLDAGYATLTVLSGPHGVQLESLDEICWQAEHVLTARRRQSA